MSLSLTLAQTKSFSFAELVSSAKLNQALYITGALSGAVDTSQIEDDAVTPAKEGFGAWHWASTGGTANAIVLTTGNSLTGTPATGTVVAFKAASANTAAVDVTIDSYSAANVYKHGGTELVADDLRSGGIYELRFDGTHWQVMGSLGRREVIVGIDANSGDNYEFTTDPPVTVHALGDIVYLQANTQNTGPASLGGVAIKKQKDQDLASGDIKADQWLVLVHDGTYWQMVSPVSNTQAPGIPGTNAGLVVQPNAGTPDSKMDVDADWLSVSDGSGNTISLQGVDLTIDITLPAQQNGRDTALAEAADEDYWLYVCYDQATATAFGLISPSDTAPDTGITYTHHAKVGWVRNVSGDFAQHASYRQGRWYLESAELTGDAAAAATFTVAHPFGRKPQRFHATAVCVSADLGFAVGDEVLAAVISESSTGVGYDALQLYVNTTNLVLRQGYPVSGSSGGLAMLGTTGAATFLGNDGSGNSDWNWKIYAEF